MQRNFTNVTTTATGTVYPSWTPALTLCFLCEVSVIQHFTSWVFCCCCCFFFLELWLNILECQLAIVIFYFSGKCCVVLATFYQFWHVTSNSTIVTKVLRFAYSIELSYFTSGFGFLLIFSFLSCWKVFTLPLFFSFVMLWLMVHSIYMYLFFYNITIAHVEYHTRSRKKICIHEQSSLM